MKKLTRYTNIEELKTSDNQIQSQGPDLKYQSDLIECIAVMKQHSSSPEQAKTNHSSNKSGSGK